MGDLFKNWENLFEKYKISETIQQNGFFPISRNQLAEAEKSRMSFLYRECLPEIFRKNHLALLPIEQEKFILAPVQAYHQFTLDYPEINHFSMPEYLESMNHQHIHHQQTALFCALASGIIADFVEDEGLLPVYSDEIESERFSFEIAENNSRNRREIYVENAPFQPDAFCEGKKYLSLIQASRFLTDNFLIGYLYYPYRVWQAKVRKKVKSILLVYTNGIYHLYEFRFNDPYSYNSISLVKQKRYSLERSSVTKAEISSLLERIPHLDEQEKFFPKAENFRKVINFCELLDHQEYFSDDACAEASQYLGLTKKIDKEHSVYALTTSGKKILSANFHERQLAYCECILSHGIFFDLFMQYWKTGIFPDESAIAETLTKNHFSETSAYIPTVKNWLNWIIQLIS